MKRFAYATALAVLVATVGFGASASGAASKKVAFKGAYAGKATEKVTGQTVKALAKGHGKGTALGKGTIKGSVKGTTANPPCSPIAGPGVITGKKGKLKVKVVKSRACGASEEEQNKITVSGTVKVKGGTGKFKKAKGKLHFSGRYNRSSGAFSIKLTGTLKY